LLNTKNPAKRCARWAASFAAWLLMMAGIAATGSAHAASYRDLAVVNPVISCGDLAKTDVSSAVDGKVTIASASVISTPKGRFCAVKGNIEPTIGFIIDLPLNHWTQRFFEGGCGGLCGMMGIRGIEHASGCLPALNGEFVVASDDMGHESQMGSATQGAFGYDSQKRIDFAYRGNHDTALVAKALISKFYGQAPKYSYFMGCSDGGREALMEAQRFPTDFDGISAGDPAALFVEQNSFYHAWNALSDKRADGTNILTAPKLDLIHAAVIAKCPTLSGVSDGLLVDPAACDFDPVSIACATGASDTSQCLTPDELKAATAQYGGATDGQGHYFSFGAQKGGEALWRQSLPLTGDGTSMSIGMAASSIQYLELPQVDTSYDVNHFQFSEANWAQVTQLAPLYDAANTDLKPFKAHGGKLILYHGLSDTSITPGVAIAYYEGVQKFIGVAETDKFLRFFEIPGMWHCGGGDGYNQFDLLSPLMAWTELGKAPAELVTGRPAPGNRGPGAPGRGGPPRGMQGMTQVNNPLASGPTAVVATRPAFPYPYIPQYSASGDPNDAANYKPVKSSVGEVAFPSSNEALKLIGPDNQKNYHVVNNSLVVG